jgi:predicted lactoylglutathione lyase
MALVRMQNAYFVSADMDAGCRFYEAIGFRPKFRDGSRWAQFDLAGHNFSLACADEAPDDARGAVLVFESDAPADHKILVEAGATSLSARDMGDHGYVRTYTDPNGHLIQIFWKAAVASKG